MCTNITARFEAAGSAKGREGWFALDSAYVGYDHPVHASLEHAVLIDLVNEASGPGARVALELPRDAARALATRILEAVDAADRYEQDAHAV